MKAHVPLRRLFRLVHGGTPTAEASHWEGDIQWATPVDLASVHGGVLAATERTLTTKGLLSGSRSVPRGSIILSTRAPIGYVAQTSTETSFNQGCRGLVPIAEMDIRFHRYQLASQAVLLQALGQGSTFVELATESLANHRVSHPPIDMQRVIAAFLDAETTRIDALIAKKEQLISRLAERQSIQVEMVLRQLADRWGEAPLKSLALDVTVGIVVTPAAWYVDHGVPALRGVNVKPGKIALSDAVHISEDGHRVNSKSALKAGDVVVVRTGQAGVAAVVPAGLDGCNCIDLLIIRPGRSLDSDFLEFVLNSDWTQKRVIEHSVGTIQAHFNVAALKHVPVPAAPAEEQLSAVAKLTVLRDVTTKTADRLVRQIALLREHRQALIMAAVTGELHIPEANRSRSGPEPLSARIS